MRAGIGARESKLNYFAHALPLLRDPDRTEYALAGIAVPDWLGVAAKRTKCRTRHAEPYLQHADTRLSEFAWGVARHHADDQWFHESAAFAQLSLDFARRLREAFADADGMRPWFLGHILVELLLDASLIAREPSLLDEYYEQVATVDAAFVEQTVEQMTGRPAGDLAWFIGKYVEIRFLADYADDHRLLHRLNQVMKRVTLPEIPLEFLELLPGMRDAVDAATDALTLRPA
ncbi:hypothetical protein Pla123a_31320 [Posidoniimonas polymericola]|uniref:Phospholipase C/D domain-containing protein n=1 Tax=Posidoniimonas polymericola TaxID=2528002 RepID=A0A5C5YL72_9BACT|nr:hypothetical protein [Posidoniimonas polymericola]TWT75622.1 hypothetical protein Pla123a_31320 [Posidoniimonas polymericola]